MGADESMEKKPIEERGLDLTSIDHTTPDEIAAFRSAVLESRGGKLMYPLSAYSFLLANRPDMLKLHFLQMQNVFSIPDEGEYRILIAATMLHWYTCHRFTEGINAEVRSCQREGASKEQINEVLAIALIHSGPSGFRFVYHAVFDYLTTYVEPDKAAIFPRGWGPDPEALKSGMDFSTPECSRDDKNALFSWYERNLGEVPRSVRMLARYNPAYLKAYRARVERTMRGALPKQLLPYMELHYNMNRGFEDGIREAALLGRGWGMTRAEVMHAVTFGTGYMAGLEGLNIVDRAIGDVLDSWEQRDVTATDNG